MSGWIKLEKDLLLDPRVKRMSHRLENECNATALQGVTLVIGALSILWMHADAHVRPDDTLDLGPNEIDQLVGITGFCQICPDDWLQIVDADRVKLPGFHKHNGTEARKKALTQKRVAAHRNASALQDGNAPVLPDQDQDQDQDQTKTQTKTKTKTQIENKTYVAQSATDVVFEHWKSVHGHPRAQLDPKRRKLILRALESYSPEDLCQSITGYRNSPHHQGQNDRQTVYDSIDLLLRDSGHIDAGMKFYQQPPATQHSSLTAGNIARTQQWLEQEEIAHAK